MPTARPEPDAARDWSWYLDDFQGSAASLGVSMPSPQPHLVHSSELALNKLTTCFETAIPLSGEVGVEPNSCKIEPSGFFTILMSPQNLPPCSFDLSRRAPPGKCKYKPVRVKTKSKRVPFRPLASESVSS